MKKIICLLLVCCFMLSGCIINKVSVIKISGDRLGFPVGGMIPASGKDIKGLLVRWFFWTNEKGREIPPMPEIIIKEKGSEETTDDKIEVITNFTPKNIVE